MEITTQVVNAIRLKFAPKDAEEVISTLENAPNFPNTVEFERIQFAILVRAQGSVDLFNEALALATLDWRDILVAAHMAQLNWPDKVLKEGLADKDWYDQTIEKIRKSG